MAIPIFFTQTNTSLPFFHGINSRHIRKRIVTADGNRNSYINQNYALAQNDSTIVYISESKSINRKIKKSDTKQTSDYLISLYD